MLLAISAISPRAEADHATEMKGREAFAAGRYDQALEIFAKLYAETLHPVYLRNIGRCHQKMREPDKAIDAFQDYLAKEKISPEEKAEIEGYIKDMNALREEQARQVPVPPTKVGPITPIAAPPATAMPPAVAAAPAPSASATLVASPPPSAAAESPVYTRWWFWTAIGVVVAGGVVAALALSGGGTTKPPCPAAILCE